MGESKGYCFITFANIESANAAPCDGLPIWGCWWMLGLLGCLPCLCNAMVLGISRLDRLEFWDICGGSNSQWNRHTWWTLAWRDHLGEVLANYESNTVEGKWVDCKPPSWLGSAEHDPNFATQILAPRQQSGGGPKAGVPWRKCLVRLLCLRHVYVNLCLFIQIHVKFIIQSEHLKWCNQLCHLQHTTHMLNC